MRRLGARRVKMVLEVILLRLDCEDAKPIQAGSVPVKGDYPSKDAHAGAAWRLAEQSVAEWAQLSPDAPYPRYYACVRRDGRKCIMRRYPQGLSGAVGWNREIMAVVPVLPKR
jgi:hypothetical protein